MEELKETEQYGSHYNFIPELIDYLGVKKIAEIGVLKGRLAKFILRRCPSVEVYYAIDPWRIYLRDYGSETAANRKQDFWDEMYEGVVEKLKPYENVEIMRLSSVEAAKNFNNDSLDFVYIDASHKYESVLEDIAIWWPKVQSQGYLAGHDMRRRFPGVRRAVEEFFGDQYRCGDPLKNWGYSWLVSKQKVQ